MGRPANSPNKNKSFLMNRLQAMYGEEFHPIMSIAKNAHALQDIANDKQRELEEYSPEEVKEGEEASSPNDLITAVIVTAKQANEQWEKLAPYVEPKLTATTMDITATELTHEQWVGALNEQE